MVFHISLFVSYFTGDFKFSLDLKFNMPVSFLCHNYPNFANYKKIKQYQIIP